MSQRTINFALSEHLAKLNLPTQYENAKFTPQAGVTYLAEFFLPAATTPVGMEFGSTDDFTGLYQVNVCAPKDSAKAPGMAVAVQVIRHFARGTTLLRDGLSVQIERADELPAAASGDRWIIPLRMRYRCLTRQ